MALTLIQKSSVRRHLGYPVAGLVRLSPAGGTLASGAAGYRFTQNFGFLEYKMNNLNPDEEARITGYAIASFILSGPQPNLGDTITAIFSGGNIPIGNPQTVTVTAGTPQAGDGRLTIIAAMAAAVSLNPVLQAAGIIAVAPYGTGAFSQNAVPVPEIAFTSAVNFNIAVSGTGQAAPQITSNGIQLPPTTTLDGINTIFGYLPILDGLEGAYASSSQNLDTSQADVWKARSNELGQRMSLYRVWQGMLSDFLGTPINPTKKNHASDHGAMKYA